MSVSRSLLVCALILLASCASRGSYRYTLRGSGVALVETRDVDFFDSIETQGSLTVHASVGPEASVFVRGDDNLVPHVETYVRDSTLVVSFEDGFSYSSHEEMRIDVTVPELESFAVHGSGDGVVTGLYGDHVSLSVDGSGDLHADGRVATLEAAVHGSGDLVVEELEAGEAVLEVRGSGDVAVRGEVGTLIASLRGSGDLSLAELHAGDARVSLHGSGDVVMFARDHLEVHISGSGDVRYRGSPRVEAHIEGSGTVRPSSQ